MTRLFFITLLIFGLSDTGMTQNSEDIYSIFLVRHAEKNPEPPDPADPGLSECGQLRAEALATILADANLRKIYSTSYERTLATARPALESLGLDVETYDPRELEAVALLLLDRQQNALVIGHSNTTSVLAGLLAGEKQEEFAEDIYDRLYQVVVSGKHKRMILLHQAFRCSH